MNVYLFDIDGTLLSPGGAGRQAMREAFALAFPESACVVERVAFSGRTDRAIIRDMLTLAGLDYHPDRSRQFLQVYLRCLPSCLARSNGQVLPGVSELLDQLAARDDVALGLLTGNLRQGAMLKLAHFGLTPERFAFGGYGDEHYDRADVAREAMQAMREHLRQAVHAERVWVIGDTPHDISCARAIGARAVAVTTGIHDREELAACEPDLLLDDLRGALAMLAR